MKPIEFNSVEMRLKTHNENTETFRLRTESFSVGEDPNIISNFDFLQKDETSLGLILTQNILHAGRKNHRS